MGPNAGNTVKRPKTSISTGHSRNIYTAKWLGAGEIPERIVTGSADGEVRVFSQSSRTSGSNRLSKEFTLEHILGRGHQGRIRCISVDSVRPDALFRSAGEDGRVLEYDLRDPSTISSGGSVLINAHSWHISFYSIDSSSLCPWYMALGGVEPVVRIYDRRFLSREGPFATEKVPSQTGICEFKNFLKDDPPNPKWTDAFDNPVRFCTPGSEDAGACTSVCFMPDSMNLLASFSNDPIYRIDMSGMLESNNENRLYNRNRTEESLAFDHFQKTFVDKNLKNLQSSRIASIFWMRQLQKLHKRYSFVPLWSMILAMEQLNAAIAQLLGEISKFGIPLTEKPKELVENTAKQLENLKAPLGSEDLDQCWTLIWRFRVLECLWGSFDNKIRWAIRLAAKYLLPSDTLRLLMKSIWGTTVFDFHQLMDPLSYKDYKEWAIKNQQMPKQSFAMPGYDYQIQKDEDFIAWTFAALQPIHLVNSQTWKLLQSQKVVIHGSAQEYVGHVNVYTAKQVSILPSWSKDRHVVASGSDLGYFFLWDYSTGDILFVGKSDNRVVNCVQAHPKTPIVAVSGMDNVVRIWEPKFGDIDDIVTAANQYDQNFPIQSSANFIPMGRINPIDYNSILEELNTSAPLNSFISNTRVIPGSLYVSECGLQ